MKSMLLKWLVVVLVLGTTATVILSRLVPRDIPPPDVSDLRIEYPAVPEEENAYPLFVSAAKHLHAPEDISLLWLAVRNNTGVDPDAITAVLDGNRQAFALIEQGLERARCLPPEAHSSSPNIDWTRIGLLLNLKGSHHLLQGRNDEAAEACMTLLRVGNMIRKDSQDLLSNLWAVSLIYRGLYLAREIANDASTPHASREALRHVLDSIGSFEEGYARGFKTEYWVIHHAIDDLPAWVAHMRRAPVEDLEGLLLALHPFPSSFLHPNRTRQLAADCTRIMIANSCSIYADLVPYEIESIFDPDMGSFRMFFQLNIVGRLSLYGGMFAIDNSYIHSKIQLECDLAATRLLYACIAYREEQGRYPATLETLVPDYIEAVPIDPYDGQPFRYDAAQGLLYAVGLNLIDFGGMASTADDTQPVHMHTDKDIVYKIGTDQH